MLIENTKVKKALRSILVILNLVAAIGLVAVYLSVYIPPDKFWIPGFIGLSYPLLLGINILFILFWLVFCWKYTLISLLTILVGFGAFSRFFQLKGKSAEATDVKVLTYNIRNFQGDYGSKENHKQNSEKIISFLDESNADIICLQESRLRRNDIFNLEKTVKDLKRIQHYQFASSGSTFGSVTMTRFPIVNMGEIRFEKSTNISIFTDMLIKGDTVRVYNLHLQSYHIDPKNYAILESVDIQEEKNREVYRQVAGLMKHAFVMRAAQAREIRKHIDESPYPVIVCGDFNDTSTSYSYYTIKNGLVDAFVNSGHGVGRTYVGQMPSFRIDYILHSKLLKSYNFETLDFKYSDHLPIVCDFVLED